MIGLLTAMPGTRLYQRLEQEGRLLFKASGDNTDGRGSLNFIPKMDRKTIIDGYQWVMNTIICPKCTTAASRLFFTSTVPRW